MQALSCFSQLSTAFCDWCRCRMRTHRYVPVEVIRDRNYVRCTYGEKASRDGYFVCLVYLLGTLSSLPPAVAITGRLSTLGSTFSSLITDRTPGTFRPISSAAAFCWTLCTGPFS